MTVSDISAATRRRFHIGVLRRMSIWIDLIIERPGMPKALIEITSSEKITERDTQALNHFYPDLGPAEAFCLSRDPHQKKIDAVWCLPWQEGLAKLGV